MKIAVMPGDFVGKEVVAEGLKVLQVAAKRFGFKYEGLFRQHMVVKGKSRDTAWYSIIDSEWPARKAAFERWLDPANFDAQGRQKVSLSSLNGRAA